MGVFIAFAALVGVWWGYLGWGRVAAAITMAWIRRSRSTSVRVETQVPETNEHLQALFDSPRAERLQSRRGPRMAHGKMLEYPGSVAAPRNFSGIIGGLIVAVRVQGSLTG
jgi:hypothetical protein